jgi:hypothetical protein
MDVRQAEPDFMMVGRVASECLGERRSLAFL